ncbi:MAG TPA: peptide chain release factor N(5)-glutamine methyltransferase [Anaerolineaceae bacterium]|jgi:release factor glutamine methyltransferase|nr:peptide chain release factor N(5)-glutamine methyltransferase [Anaerolineaceae bacterium]
MTTNNISSWVAEAIQQLALKSDTPGLEAQLLLAHILGWSRTQVVAHPEQLLTVEQHLALDGLLARRVAGEPLPYLLGEWEFYGLKFQVTPAVLIPRPETELLVEVALAWLQAHPDRRRAADVGTGSGCIAATLAWHVPDLWLTAVDLSATALQVAADNFARLGVQSRVTCRQSDLLADCRGPFDLVCANLPYIPSETLASLPVADHEPRQALDGGPDGLDLIGRLLSTAPRWLAPGGLMLLEIESGQGQSAPELAQRLLPAALIVTLPDLAGKARLLRVENKTP